MSIRTKHCKRCSKTKPIQEFFRRKVSRDGYQTYCKECMREYNSQRRHTPEVNLEPVGRDRTCTSCHEAKDLSLFPRKSAGKYHSKCKACIRAYWAEYSQRQAG